MLFRSTRLEVFEKRIEPLKNWTEIASNMNSAGVDPSGNLKIFNENYDPIVFREPTVATEWELNLFQTLDLHQVEEAQSPTNSEISIDSNIENNYLNQAKTITNLVKQVSVASSSPRLILYNSYDQNEPISRVINQSSVELEIYFQQALSLEHRIFLEKEGFIQIVRKGYLTTGEKAAAQGADDTSQIGQIVFSLSRRAASFFKVDIDAGQEIISRLMGGETHNKKEEAFLKEVEPEILDLISRMGESEKKKRIVQAYVLLHYRVNDQISIDDVIEMHPDLTDALGLLFEDEQKKSVARLEEASKNDSADTIEEVSRAAEKK